MDKKHFGNDNYISLATANFNKRILEFSVRWENFRNFDRTTGVVTKFPLFFGEAEISVIKTHHKFVL